MAELAQQPFHRHYLNAVRLYRDAFARQPQLAGAHRYNAACAAALAAAGAGADASKRDDRERARLRQQALDWLRADLALWGKQTESGTPQTRALVQKTLRHWQQDSDLAGVRDRSALASMSPGEREECQKLWADVAALLTKADAGSKKQSPQ
jgi:hypothetical protein